MKKIDSKEKVIIKKIITQIPDINSDFYITKNNLRLSIKENLNIALNDVVNGDRLFYSENSIVFICGEADKSKRNYLKFLTKTSDDLELIMNLVNKEYEDDLYAKLKKENEFIVTLLNMGFEVYKNRGKELLLFRQGKAEEL